MSFLFGRKPSLEEQLKENKKVVQRSIRELDRETRALETAERKLIVEIKAAAAKDQLGVAKIKAKDLVRTRNYIQRFVSMRAQMQAMALRLQTVKSTEAMARCMAGMTRSMTAMNKQMDIPAMRSIMMEFEKANAKMEMTEEMMSEGIDDVMAEENDEENADAILGSVMTELGIQFSEGLTSAPMSAGGVAGQNVAAGPAQVATQKQ